MIVKIFVTILLIIWAIATIVYLIYDTYCTIKGLRESKRMKAPSITKQFTCSQEAMDKMITDMKGLTVGQAIEQLKQLPQDKMLYAFDSNGHIDRVVNIDLGAYNIAFVYTKGDSNV